MGFSLSIAQNVCRCSEKHFVFAGPGGHSVADLSIFIQNRIDYITPFLSSRLRIVYVVFYMQSEVHVLLHLGNHDTPSRCERLNSYSMGQIPFAQFSSVFSFFFSIVVWESQSFR